MLWLGVIKIPVSDETPALSALNSKSVISYYFLDLFYFLNRADNFYCKLTGKPYHRELNTIKERLKAFPINT